MSTGMKIVTVNGKTPEEYGYENPFYPRDGDGNAFITAAALVQQCIGYRGEGFAPEQLERGVNVEVVLLNDDGERFVDSVPCMRFDSLQAGDYSGVHGTYVPPGVPSARTRSWWHLPRLILQDVTFGATRDGERWVLHQTDRNGNRRDVATGGERVVFSDAGQAWRGVACLNEMAKRITPTQYDVACELSLFYCEWKDRQEKAARDEASVIDEEPTP